MSPKLQISFLSAVAFLFMSVLVFRLALLKRKHVKVVSENLVSALQEFYDTEKCLLVLFRQTVSLCFENCTKTHTGCVCKVRSFVIENPRTTYSDHCAFDF